MKISAGGIVLKYNKGIAKAVGILCICISMVACNAESLPQLFSEERLEIGSFYSEFTLEYNKQAHENNSESFIFDGEIAHTSDGQYVISLSGEGLPINLSFSYSPEGYTVSQGDLMVKLPPSDIPSSGILKLISDDLKALSDIEGQSLDSGIVFELDGTILTTDSEKNFIQLKSTENSYILTFLNFAHGQR